MSRRSIAKKPEQLSKPEAPTAVGPGQFGILPVRLKTIAVRSLQYTELEREPGAPPLALGSTGEINLDMRGVMNLFAELTVEMRVNFVVTPDPAHRPLQLNIELSALFEGSPPLSTQQLLRFVNESGSRIVFPYLREIVSAATGRGIFGALFLDPIVLGPLMPEAELEPLTAKSK